MKHRYLPMTDQDQADMLAAVGAETIEDLFADIPKAVRYNGVLPMSKRLGEPELLKHMRRLSDRNADFDRYTSFLGAGLYDHHIPVVLNHVISRSEFYTAYTPYQPEISQGELQAIFEFQSYICELTGMKVANASMYDGSTALAEAAALASGATKRKKIVISRAVHPEAREIVLTSARGLDLDVVEVGIVNGVTDQDALAAAITDDTAAVLLQSPNFFGCIEDVKSIEPLVHEKKALLVLSVNPLSLGLLESPGVLGADIVVGDAQPLGIPASLGGPTCGFFAVSEPLMRRIPGRIVGQTVDQDGKRGFVLTLQAREQHIRREKATSNICSNQALLALCASVYMSTLGKAGMQEAALLNVRKSHYAADRIAKGNFSLPFSSPFFNEFVVKLPEGTNVKEVNSKLLGAGYIGGYDLGTAYPELQGCMLIAVTERRTKEEIDQFIGELEAIV
ncbi:aminomethyl-transferring glycine dehydrogenase subunit GcvPA [Virgibacillus sp. LDC1]|uniref:aminomethyl-transferring glycine dehydrogenase subunit GcvPA n=1 Tax=unclassified Paenibacillus TaxID=185978 RepID=UPI000C26FE5A|nr:aminomethyl-transferring glycine dehydrogenase subunit GcvPA [Paenibacillus sp. GM2FR]MCV4231632.1 aminomethyl-transferring glycine dehydrogenase subunit GcvPA [Virgibacillus sp. LDC1]PJN55536.1 putative glycine dehydrogenase (decarboxylating) subunit 1 [Paenibacillus sp. GM2FR]